MKIVTQIFFITFFINALISCDSKNNVSYVKCTNNSQRTLVLYYSIDYPDTSFNKIYRCNCDAIMPLTNCDCGNEFGWNYSNKLDLLLFYLWDKDTINKYGFENCRSNEKTLKKYKYSVNELENLNWTITYP